MIPIDFDNMTIDDLQFALLDIEEQLQSVMSLILLTKALIRDLELEKTKMNEAIEIIEKKGV